MASLIDTLRSVRIGPFAIFDFVASLIGMYFIAHYFKINKVGLLLLTVPIGVLVHVLFGTKTALNKMLFEEGNKIAILVVLVLLVSGLYYLDK